MSDQWHIAVGGKSKGPFSTSQIRSLANSGKLNAQTLVWREGMQTWQAAGSVGGLLASTAAAAPPVPPAVPTSGGATPVPTRAMSSAVSAVETAAGRLNEVTQTDPFRLADVLRMFQRVFVLHGTDEVESQFGVGLPATTPPLSSVHDRVARPWFFTRALLFLGLAFVALLMTYRGSGNNPLLVPAIVFTGSFAAPLAMAIFFYECNLPANVSLYAMLRMFTWGGILGIVLSLVLFRIDEALPTRWLGASVAAMIEEPGKLAAVVLLSSRRRYPWTLNGLCLGAAVGAGFAAFESAGYALTAFIDMLMATHDTPRAYAVLLGTLINRGLLSPFAHVVWTAVTAGALWRVIHDAPLRPTSFADWRFASPFIAVVLLHFTWNSGLFDSLPFSGKYLALGAIAWTIAFGLLFTGFREVREAATSARHEA